MGDFPLVVALVNLGLLVAVCWYLRGMFLDRVTVLSDRLDTQEAQLAALQFKLDDRESRLDALDSLSSERNSKLDERLTSLEGKA
jgi:hypothetical protein